MLLIGSTGNGKSTLGNYLLDPKETEQDTFETAIDNRPQTKICKHVTGSLEIVKPETMKPDEFSNTKDVEDYSEYDYSDALDDLKISESGEISKHDIEKDCAAITIIDTPGLNEGTESDLSHMINLIETLEVMKTVRACILVVKFPCKIDQQFKDTVKYYSNLLPTLFAENVIIAMTGYGMDKYSLAVRKRQKITPEVMKVITSNVVREIMDIAPVNCQPVVFAIDSLPIEEGATESERVRGAILSYIMSCNEVSVEDLKVRKTKAVIDEDSLRISELNGEIRGYKQRTRKQRLLSMGQKKMKRELQSSVLSYVI